MNAIYFIPTEAEALFLYYPQALIMVIAVTIVTAIK